MSAEVLACVEVGDFDMMIADSSSSATYPDASSLLSETTAGEIALFIVGIIFTLGLLAAFFWITFRALREKQ